MTTQEVTQTRPREEVCGDVTKIARQLEKKYAEQAELALRLQKALAIQSVWPEAFEQGSCRISWHFPKVPSASLPSAAKLKILDQGFASVMMVKKPEDVKKAPLLSMPSILRPPLAQTWVRRFAWTGIARFLEAMAV